MKNLGEVSILIVFLVSTPLASSITYEERIILDLETVESPNGVPVDFSYNETNAEPGSLKSVPGCPKSIDGYPWVYFGNPPRCYLAGTRGPCDIGRYLSLELGSPFGVCGCECILSSLELDLPHLINTSPDGRYKFCKNQGYDAQQKICYDLQQRGPCGPGEWIVRSTSDSLTCVKECPNDDQGRTMFYNHITGECEQVSGGAGFAGSNIHRNKCRDTERYSTIRKMCVPKNTANFLVIG
ncbi:hypothetical protein Ocin01_06371 [Orchesella cincta]|uniref:DUF4789 domain-containing protein n=1 Tax=Orchesella cincta TaxID=48709 RepID=A0A1D2N4V7_ORCCI|nr:hypothetical protein Ocin01_06371 [Orchesella cincta]